MVLTSSKQIITDEYRQPVRLALTIQIPICVIALLMLDGGVLSRICGCAMLGYWLGVSLIWVRRPFTPKRSDLFLIRFGFLAAFMAAIGFRELMALLLGV